MPSTVTPDHQPTMPKGRPTPRHVSRLTSKRNIHAKARQATGAKRIARATQALLDEQIHAFAAALLDASARVYTEERSLRRVKGDLSDPDLRPRHVRAGLDHLIAQIRDPAKPWPPQ